MQTALQGGFWCVRMDSHVCNRPHTGAESECVTLIALGPSCMVRMAQVNTMFSVEHVAFTCTAHTTGCM